MGTEKQEAEMTDDLLNVLAAECYMEEPTETWFPAYSSCTLCQGYIYAPVAAGDEMSVSLGICPCAAAVLEDEEESVALQASQTQTALSLSAAVGIEDDPQCKSCLDGSKFAKSRQVPSKHSGRGSTGYIQRNQRKHRNIMQPRPGF